MDNYEELLSESYFGIVKKKTDLNIPSDLLLRLERTQNLLPSFYNHINKYINKGDFTFNDGVLKLDSHIFYPPIPEVKIRKMLYKSYDNPESQFYMKKSYPGKIIKKFHDFHKSLYSFFKFANGASLFNGTINILGFIDKNKAKDKNPLLDIRFIHEEILPDEVSVDLIEFAVDNDEKSYMMDNTNGKVVKSDLFFQDTTKILKKYKNLDIFFKKIL